MKYILLISLSIFLGSCDYFKQNDTRIPVARVNKNFLFEEDIKALISENTNPEDSALIVSSYIQRWATQQLLMDKAKINLTTEQQTNYDKLIEQYKNDLYIESYKNAIVNRQLDSTVSEQEYIAYYNENKENFVLQNELVKIRYIELPKEFTDVSVTRERLNRFNNKDLQELNKASIQFKSFNFNDSIWVQKDKVLEVLPSLTSKQDELLKTSNNIQFQDSLGVYLVRVLDVLKTEDVAPLEYIKPTIKQIILNKRKLELIKNLEKDITKDAIKNKDFEIY